MATKNGFEYQRIRLYYKLLANGQYITYNLRTKKFHYESDDYIVSAWAIPKVFVRYVKIAIEQFGVDNISIVSSYYGKHVKSSREHDRQNCVIEEFTVQRFFKRYGFEYVNFRNIFCLSKKEKEVFDFLFSYDSTDKALKYFNFSKNELDCIRYNIHYKLKFGKLCELN